MRIIKASHMGQCFGVRDAIALARKTASETGRPLTVAGDLVHNPTVLKKLMLEGIRFAPSPVPEAAPPGSVMITAHGTSDSARIKLAGLGNPVVDGTCPLVGFAHRALNELVAEGCYPVIVGIANHVEVVGLTADLNEFTVVLNPPDLELVPTRPLYGLVAQTTQPLQRVMQIRDDLQRRFPSSEIRMRDTVCQPTKLRQQAAVSLAHECDLVIVVGGRKSNNTRELVKTCGSRGARTIQIENASEMVCEWFENVEIVGVTAGTSTPDSDIEEVCDWLDKEKARRSAPLKGANDVSETVEQKRAFLPESTAGSGKKMALLVG